MTWEKVLELVQNGNFKAPRRVEKSNKQWEKELPKDVFFITRQQGTEQAFSSEMCSIFLPAKYSCACCETPLFDSTQKFESNTGWPSFTEPLKNETIAYKKDTSYLRVRIEVLCNICDAHLGHVFPDGPKPSGLRYCINALALKALK